MNKLWKMLKLPTICPLNRSTSGMFFLHSKGMAQIQWWSFGFRHLAGANRRLGFCGLREIQPWQTFDSYFLGRRLNPMPCYHQRSPRSHPHPVASVAAKGSTTWVIIGIWIPLFLAVFLNHPSLFPTANLLHFSLWGRAPRKTGTALEPCWNLSLLGCHDAFHKGI